MHESLENRQAKTFHTLSEQSESKGPNRTKHKTTKKVRRHLRNDLLNEFLGSSLPHTML
uniref:Uncharacterized protein n=1 Tax=uncultured myxobacterium HF0200_19H16 TaxID=723559 RepID=E7C3W2_9BACT|nr:hypothetical protein [uncultured myxobacterium HF0200_19H16]